jgi:hypothetical protein
MFHSREGYRVICYSAPLGLADVGGAILPRPLAWADIALPLRGKNVASVVPQPRSGDPMSAQANGLGRWRPQSVVPQPRSGDPMSAQANGLGTIAPNKSRSPNGAK